MGSPKWTPLLACLGNELLIINDISTRQGAQLGISAMMPFAVTAESISLIAFGEKGTFTPFELSTIKQQGPNHQRQLLFLWGSRHIVHREDHWGTQLTPFGLTNYMIRVEQTVSTLNSLHMYLSLIKTQRSQLPAFKLPQETKQNVHLIWWIICQNDCSTV